MYQGRARHPVMVALAETVARYAIPIDPFEALIDAFVQDQSVTEYLTYPQLLDYCTRSANPVGHLVLYVAGAFTEENARLSDATCTALQLANFWQDVARDLAIGRIYLPREDRERFGYADDDLRALRFTPAFAGLMKFEVERTRQLFEEGRALVPRIPGELAVDIDLFSRGGLAILDRIEARGFDVLTARPTLSKWTKIGLLGRALPRPGAGPAARQTARGQAPPAPAGDRAPHPAQQRLPWRASGEDGPNARGELSTLRRDRPPRGAQFLLRLPAASSRSQAGDVRALCLHAAHRRPGR